MASATATKELLAPRGDVWAFVSTAGRLADCWPGIFAAQDHGDTQAVVALGASTASSPDDAFVESILGRLYDLCQTGADA